MSLTAKRVTFDSPRLNQSFNLPISGRNLAVRRAARPHNTRHNGALLGRSVPLHCFCRGLVMCARPGPNGFVECGLAHASLRGKNNGVVTRNVMRDAAALQDGSKREIRAFALRTIGEFRAFARTDSQPNPQSGGKW